MSRVAHAERFLGVAAVLHDAQQLADGIDEEDRDKDDGDLDTVQDLPHDGARPKEAEQTTAPAKRQRDDPAQGKEKAGQGNAHGKHQYEHVMAVRTLACLITWLHCDAAFPSQTPHTTTHKPRNTLDSMTRRRNVRE